MRTGWGALLILLLSTGCPPPAPSVPSSASPAAPSPHAAQAKEQLSTTGDAATASLGNCNSPESRLRPFVVTWDTTEQAEFAAQGQGSLLVMRVDQCKIELLAGCQVPGEYRLRTTPEGFQSLDVRSKSELGVKLPFAVAELGGHLEKSGGLSLRYFVRGVSYATAPALYRVDLKAGCEGATHFVVNYVAGAYEVAESSAEGGGASASVMGVGAKASTAQSSSALLRGGSLADCKSGGPGCLAPVRLRLLPIIETPPEGAIAAAHQAAVTRPAPSTEQRTTLTPGQVVAVVNTVKPAIAACRSEHSPAEGRILMKTKFQIGADGVVTHVEVETATESAFVKCVQDALYSARFPAARDPTTVRYPFVL